MLYDVYLASTNVFQDYVQAMKLDVDSGHGAAKVWCGNGPSAEWCASDPVSGC
jgi:hypothetical protein